MPQTLWEKDIPCPDPDALDDEPLDEASAKKALEELHEDPKERLGQIETLGSWLKTQPHLIAPLDNRYLLQMLRASKFSQLRARTMIEGSLKLMAEWTDWFQEVDTNDSYIYKVLDKGMWVPLPYDDEGRIGFLFRVGSGDPNTKEYTLEQEMKAIIAVYYYYMMKSKIQVNGIVWIMDFKDVTMKHFIRYSTERMQKVDRAIQGAMPGRYKAIHICNTGPVFETFFTLFKTVLWKKVLERMHVHGSNLEGLYQHVPLRCLPDEYLPDDYDGPSAGSVDHLVGELKKEMQAPEVREWMAYNTQSKWRIDESKRVKDDQPQASFRKLNID